MGTNNSLTTTSAAGEAWGNAVDTVSGWLRSNPEDTAYKYAQNVRVVGGSDLEQNYSSGSAARSWASGYANASNIRFYNYGTCSGCPPAGGTPNGGWSLEDVYTVSWGSPNAWPLPEIYATSGINAYQWSRLAEWGVSEHGTAMRFNGSLTQRLACSPDGCPGTDIKPGPGWRYLWIALNNSTISDVHQRRPLFLYASLDIGHKEG